MRDALPNASFFGFTGTPIEQTDANRRAVFGDYISVYDIQRAVTVGATVPILAPPIGLSAPLLWSSMVNSDGPRSLP